MCSKPDGLPVEGYRRVEKKPEFDSDNHQCIVYARARHTEPPTSQVLFALSTRDVSQCIRAFPEVHISVAKPSHRELAASFWTSRPTPRDNSRNLTSFCLCVHQTKGLRCRSSFYAKDTTHTQGFETGGIGLPFAELVFEFRPFPNGCFPFVTFPSRWCVLFL